MSERELGEEYVRVAHILEMIRQGADFDFHKWLMTTDTNFLMWGNSYSGD